MGQISRKLRSGEGGMLTYWCQGCEEPHSVWIGEGQWTFDGNVEAPTFSPSVLLRSGHFAEGFDPAKKGCWCTFDAEQIAKGHQPSGFKCRRCHTFIRGGLVEFLSDCSHDLAGQTLAVPDLPAHMRDAA